jgi:transmembrane sensor
MDSRPTPEVIERAARWHVRLHAEDVSDADRMEFESWRNQRETHAKAYAQLEAVLARFDGLQPEPAMMALETALQSTPSGGRRRKSRAGSIALAIVLIAAGALAVQTDKARYMLADYHTEVGRQQVVELADDSRIILNTYTAMDVDFSETERRIILHQGEILVEVAGDAARPFIVETTHGTARALGTQFIVKRIGDATDITVVESVVEACGNSRLFNEAEKQCVRLHAAEGTQITKETILAPRPVDLESASGWTEGFLTVDSRPLAEVLSELQRYRKGSIHFNPDDIADMRVSGVLPLKDTNRALEMLAALLPIRIDHSSAETVDIRPR